MVYRVYSEKKKDLSTEALLLKTDIQSLLDIKGLEDLRIVNRYDLENISKEVFEEVKTTLLSEPPLDHVYHTLEHDPDDFVFAVEFLPGQYDQRADSAAQCVQFITQQERPIVRSAKVYILKGNLSEQDIAAIKKYVINPVEAREATLETYDTLQLEHQEPEDIQILEGFIALDADGLKDFLAEYELAMDFDDLSFCQDYFKSENRDPSLTEIRVIDTYWSDHCRHTTFLTSIDKVTFEDELLEKTYQEYLQTRKNLNRKKPINLMDIGTLAAKALKANGQLDRLDASEEINACTVKIDVEIEGKTEKWLLLFKNETHNHPTEIEPFGGAATCIGGAIRDPLSGRAYVYAAMRVTGAANPLDKTPVMPGKLPQRKIVTTAADGYSSYGNQIGLATGQVDELYHPGYAAKRMEIGAVVAATPEENVRREEPAAGDIVILLGGKTGRDGCGGATGSSKSHTVDSLEKSGAEVQKGNAPEERKIQRLFRKKEASVLIKRCNDFGAGGVSVAVGELADGLEINLDLVPKKYEGLDGTELAISESQERMAVVVASEDAEHFIDLAHAENLEATKIAVVTESPRLVMHWRNQTIVDLSREFMNSNGAEKHIEIAPENTKDYDRAKPTADFADNMKALVDDLNVCSKRGLSEQFDSTVGAGTVLMPFGGKYQKTPIQAMVHQISIENRNTENCSLMAWGYNPYISEKSPYHGAYLAVNESIAKLIAAGSDLDQIYLTFQEYFEKPLKDPKRWGKPLSALLGAFKAQMDYGITAIGGKDSMSGSFEHLDVPPTLVSFAVTTDYSKHIISPEFKNSNHQVLLFKPHYDKNNLPEKDSQISLFKFIANLIRSGKVKAAYTPGYGGIAEAIFKMAIGNQIGFTYESNINQDDLFAYSYGSFIIELNEDFDLAENKDFTSFILGQTIDDYQIQYDQTSLSIAELETIYENKLESVFHTKVEENKSEIPEILYQTKSHVKPKQSVQEPRVLIPVFPGNNCEYDTAKAWLEAGAKPHTFVVNNLSFTTIKESVEQFAKEIQNSQIIFIPGGFSGGDEPEGSAKFITSFFRNQQIMQAVENLMDQRDGLICGICNGFQALVKLGLVPFGKIVDSKSDSPTLTFNTIHRHQSKIVQTKVVSNKSPWLAEAELNQVYHIPISHGEGRFLADEATLNQLIENGQIATQYVDMDGQPSYDIQYNPNGSVYAVEGITSPDGRIFGKMGHSERVGKYLYKNVIGEHDMGLFRSAVKYFQG